MKTIYQHLFINNKDLTWPVDIQAAAKAMAWINRTPDILEQDLTGMATYFPHWILVGATQERPLLCRDCERFYVPLDGAMRCLKCRRLERVSGLLWLGQLPIPARSEPAFQPGQERLRRAGFAEVNSGQTTYLLVPLTVRYPTEWPNQEPIVRYAKPWLKALHLPLNSGYHHLIQGGRACIFSWGQWQAMPIQVVLQQRMVNHALSLFKIVAGQRPADAFIGRIHNRAWQPERSEG